jgi:hypothetical protein
MVKALHLVLKSGIEGGGLHAPVWKDDRAAIRNGADGFKRGNQFHTFLITASRHT